MAVALKIRRGTTTEHSSFVGEEGEITIEIPVDGSGNKIYGNTSNPWTLKVHDGQTSGGHPLIAGSSPSFSNPTINLTSESSGGTIDLQQDYRTRAIKMAIGIGSGDF
tara:strand:- start:401 stop:724 length:324 start_codon:yes stop_codon:yes gene_type:complete